MLSNIGGLALKTIFLFVVFRAIFDFIFMQLNKINPQLFNPLYKIPGRWRGRFLYKWISILILFLITAIIVVYFRINEILGYIMASFEMSLCEMVSKSPNKIKEEK